MPTPVPLPPPAAPRALALVERWPVRSASVGVVRRDPATGRAGVSPAVDVVDAVGDEHRSYAWASVSKVLVTLAVLVAVEEGTLALDEPAGPPRSTVRHLLAHASGLGPDVQVAMSAPGRRRIYSNAGFEVLAEHLAARAAMPFVDYLVAGVLEPLSMTGTVLAPGASAASGVHGPLRDLLTLCAELLAPTLVSAGTLAEATTVAFPGLAGVVPGYGRYDPCDWGLGLEIKDAKVPHWTGRTNSPATFGHFGRSGTFAWVDPVAAVACAGLTDTPFGPWAQQAWPALADAVVAQWA
ncbi:MAG TPA: serine hydrolase domain-containing protein [Acidimicrobiales bacterium]|nr:serine hydrolase domain-containing protein [Acidimicrobiales bacterium]